jgi:hypothetical protein
VRVGVYIHDGFTFEPQAECPYYWNRAAWERYIDWLAAHGVEIVEGCQQLGWYRYPTLPEELDRVRIRQHVIDRAHTLGMEYWLILASNVLSGLPAAQVPPGQLSIDERDCVLCPQTGDGFTRTAEVSRYFARAARGADAFEVFAGDWGGCRCGRCGVDQYLDYVRYHADHLAAEQPAARVWANLWSISSWQHADAAPGGGFESPGWRRLWDDEIAFSQRIFERLSTIPQGVGIALPLHHWYRGFCQQWYTPAELPDWPDAATLASLRAAGRPLVAWTHFIVENDPYHGRLWGTLSVRLRYIRQLCARVAQAPFEVMMGNVYSARQAVNLYALVHFARLPEQTPEEIIRAFAAEIAHPDGVALLEDTLRLLENHDPWEQDLPAHLRLPPLDTAGIDIERLQNGLPALAGLIRRDTPLLLNTPQHFVHTAQAALSAIVRDE